MMKKYEVAIQIDDDAYVDDLLLALVHQGYAVYYNEDENRVCFEATDDDVTEVTQ